MGNFLSGRKQIVVVVLLACAAMFAVLYLFRTPKGPYQALPLQAAVVLEFNGLSKANLLKKSLNDPVWKAILETTVFRNAWLDAAAAERLLGRDTLLRAAFARQKMLLGLTLSKADSLHGLFVLDVQDDINLRKLLETNPISQKIFPSVFHGRTLYTVHLGKNEQLVVAATGHLLLFSRISYLVEDALTQFEASECWWEERKWMPQLGSGAPIRMFFRPAAIATQYEYSMADGWADVPKLLSNKIEW